MFVAGVSGGGLDDGLERKLTYCPCRGQVQFPEHMGSGTGSIWNYLVPEDPVPSSGLLGHQAYTWFTNILPDK